jgi:DNA-directed RNA polymerase subunit RPC12/RpoP
MKTLEDHNHDVAVFYDQVERHLRTFMDINYQNGIECPQCGAEMSDTTDMREEVDGRTMKPIECPACGYKTTCLV